jgi:phage repressor protein C with HTH and peptisase S24 domain
MNLGKRIESRLSEMGEERSFLFDLIPDLTPARLSALIKRDSKRCELDVQIAKALKVRLEWLNDGDLPKLIDDVDSKPAPLLPSSNSQSQSQSAEFDANVTSVPLGLRPIPVISYIQAGLLTDINDPYAPGDGFATEICEDDLGRFAFALEIEGNSMQPDFRPGDRIIIDPDVSPMPGDFVVAKNGKQMATFKKYRPRGMNERGEQVFELVPLNEDYPTMRSDIEHLRVIGTMVEHRKKYRRKG